MALGGPRGWRHGVVAVAGLSTVGMAALGLIGGGDHPEKFDAKQIVVTPAGGQGLRIREVVDQDFGTHDRHGYERIIPNDFGAPIDVVARSPDAPADLSVTPLGDDTRIRIGDPNSTIDGQHRYVLEYTLPEAQLSSGQLALDIIGTTEELGTERMEVVVAGLELEDPRCNVGAFGTSGGCTLSPEGDVYRAVIAPLEPLDGVTIGGTITDISTPADVPEPALPERRSDDHSALALAMVPAAAIGGVGVFLWARRKGSNEVGGAGAADAAYAGPFPPPPPGATVARAASALVATRLVTDAQLATMATTEFVPPKGIAPWQGSVLLTERLDDSTVQAWFSGMAANGYIDLQRDGEEVTMSAGPRLDSAPPDDHAIIAKALGSSGRIELGTYDADFAAAWGDVRQQQSDAIATSGWWRGRPPGASGSVGVGGLAAFGAIWLVIIGGSVFSAAAGVLSSPPAALVFGFAVTALAALAMYRVLLPSRTAAGSALALRTESFRRFLAASEGRHVEWAWKHNILREYSAWAVALGAADAWERAMEASGIPRDQYVSGPLVMYYAGGMVARTTTAPSTSGGSGGGFSGGFSGGSVGGGGGGGSSGSW